MEWFKFRPTLVTGDPRYRRAPPDVRLAYLESASDLWSAGQTGPPALPVAAVDHGEDLVASGLAVETARGMEIPWLTAQWQANEDYREIQRINGAKRGNPEATLRLPSTQPAHEQASSLRFSSLPSPKRARGKPTWLTPFADAWKDRVDGRFAFGKAAPPLKELVADHGSEPVVEAFRVYLEATEPKHLSVARFAETYGQWSGTAKPAGPKQAPTRKGWTESGVRIGTGCTKCGVEFWVDEGHDCPVKVHA